MGDSEPDLVDDDEHVGDKQVDKLILHVHPEDDQGQNSHKEQWSKKNTEVVSTVSLYTYFCPYTGVRFVIHNYLWRYTLSTKKGFEFVSLLSTSNLVRNSCSRTVLKCTGTQLSHAPPEI